MTLSTRQYLASLLLLPLSCAPLHAQQPAPPSPEVKQFQDLEDNWSLGYVKKDQYAMELLLAPSFVDISASGAISTRNQYIAEIFTHSNGDLLSMEQRAVNVRVLGDMALVDGTYIIHYRPANASGTHSIDQRGIFTHVYQRTRSNWVAIHAQRTAVFDQSDEKQKQPGKKSSATLPFHVPLVYKGSDPAQPSPTPDKQPPQ